MNQALLALEARRWVDTQQELTSTLPRGARVLIDAGVWPRPGPHRASQTDRSDRGSGAANSSSGSRKHVSSHAGVNAST
jgi:hypothetical protein